MEDNIIMNTQVSLSRNIDHYPFPHKLSESESMVIVNKIKSILIDSKELSHEGLVAEKIKDISYVEKSSMLERHMINQEFANSNKGALLFNKDKSVNIIINDEDHINIKVYKKDFQLDEAYEVANYIDDVIGNQLDYAFNEDIGYLTCCPIKAGTGLNISVLLHLPVLSLQDKIDSYYNIANKIGLNIKGINSENSNTLGSMYRISNQSNFGISENNIIESIKSLIKDIISKEEEARDKLKQQSSIELEDEIFRSLGIIEKARIISSYEAMKHLSNIKLGIEMEYIKDINIEKIDNLMMGIKPALKLMLSSRESDIDRATYLREEFTLANRNKK